MNRCWWSRLGVLAGGAVMLVSFNTCGMIIQRQLEILLAPEVVQTSYLIPLSGFYPR